MILEINILSFIDNLDFRDKWGLKIIDNLDFRDKWGLKIIDNLDFRDKWGLKIIDNLEPEPAPYKSLKKEDKEYHYQVANLDSKYIYQT